MKTKPQMKREVAIVFHYEPLRQVTFYATADAVTEFKEYGNIRTDPDRSECYILIVDARYDFGEVLAYIQNYG